MKDFRRDVEREKKRKTWAGYGRSGFEYVDTRNWRYRPEEWRTNSTARRERNYRKKQTRKDLVERKCQKCGENLSGTHLLKWCEKCRVLVRREQGKLRQRKLRGR